MNTAKWSKKKLIAFSIITLLFIFLVIEIIFRVIFFIQYKNYHTSVYTQGNTIQKSDTGLIFMNRPFYLDFEKKHQYNEVGMKSEPGEVFMPEKKEDDFWVFLLGGSAMEGMGSNKNGEWFDITGAEDYPANQTIASILEKKLQVAMPSKQVKVFNAANSAYCISQVIKRYQKLNTKYKADWIVSLDGNNEPVFTSEDSSVWDLMSRDWKDNQTFKFPLKYIIPFTSHSAFINKLKQSLYHFKLSRRIKKNKETNFPSQLIWSTAKDQSLLYTTDSSLARKMADTFYYYLNKFDTILNNNNQHHLLLIQPHLSLRDATVMNTTEKALFNYYCYSSNNPVFNSYYRKIYSLYDSLAKNKSTIRLLQDMHSLKEQIFLDYCHFTPNANEYLASYIADIITNKRPI